MKRGEGKVGIDIVAQRASGGEQITRADGGTLYLLTDDKRHLRFEIVRTDTLKIAFGGTSGQPTSGVFADLPLYRENGEANDSLVAANAAITGEFNYQGGDRKTFYSSTGFPFANDRETFENIGPVRGREGVLLGDILVNRHTLTVFRHRTSARWSPSKSPTPTIAHAAPPTAVSEVVVV